MYFGYVVSLTSYQTPRLIVCLATVGLSKQQLIVGEPKIEVAKDVVVSIEYVISS
jgi:hypothetical protein